MKSFVEKQLFIKYNFIVNLKIKKNKKMITLKATQKGIDFINSNPQSDTAVFLLKQSNNGEAYIKTESLVKEANYLVEKGYAELVN